MDGVDRREVIWWLDNEIKKNREFIEAIDNVGHYFVLQSNKDNKEFYLDDFVSDDEFNALMAQLKGYLEGNIVTHARVLESMRNEETTNISGRDEGRDHVTD